MDKKQLDQMIAWIGDRITNSDIMIEQSTKKIDIEYHFARKMAFFDMLDYITRMKLNDK